MAETKNTKVFYNTEIPSDWEVKKSGSVIKFFGGNAFSSDDACEEGIKWLKIANVGLEATKWNDVSFLPYDFIELHKKYLLKDGDVVMALTRPILDGKLKIAKVQKSDEPCLLNQRVAKLIPKGSVDISFLYYVLQTPYYVYMMDIAMAGTDPPNIGNGDLENIKIPLPPLTEQKAIAQVLSTADAAIQTTEKLIAQKELRKKWLMQQLLTGKKRLKGFGGEWRKLGAGDVFKSVTKKGFADEELLSATQDRGMIPRTMLEGRVTMPTTGTEGFKLVEVGDFVISLRSFQGGLEYSYYRGLVSPAYTVLKPKKPINEEFYKQYFKSYDFIGHLAIAVIGIRDGKQISYDDFCTVKIPYPSTEEQTAIAQVLQAADKEISLLKAKAEKLREQKKGLMQVLLTGKVRLKNH